MNAAFKAQVEAASAQSQEMLGDTFTIDGGATVYTGVFGNPVVVDVPNVGGGYQRQAQCTVYATRDQFATTPTPKKTLTRTSGAPASFLIQAVNIHDPFFYFFNLVKIGA